MGLAFVALFGSVVWRLHELQVTQGDFFKQKAERQQTRTWTIEAPRGNLYDGDGSPLAVSDGTWTITADPRYMDDKLRATVELSRILGLDRDLLRREFENPRNGRLIAKSVDDERADKVRALKLSGVNCRRQFTRRYPEGPLASHVLGFVLADGTGGAGLEHSLNNVMMGKPGSETVTVDALGNPSISEDTSENIPAQPGAHVQLTIQLALQRRLEQVLADQVEKSHPANIMGIVVRPTTGEVLAMASWPSFDPRDPRTLDGRSMRNNAVSFVYEPGSTFKPLIVGAAISEHLANWSERIYCERGVWTYRFGRSARTIHNSHMGNENLTLTDGIAQSDNILMAKLGIRLGPEKLYDWATRLGFGQRTGITLSGEDYGLVRPKAKWDVLGSCMSVPMGHEIAVTPLQLIMAHSTIANGGEWLPPRIIKRIFTTDEKGHEIELPLPPLPAPRRVFDMLDAAQIQQAMTHTMSDTHGTGKGLQLDGYTCAGKTGTAEKLVNGHYSHSNHVGSFICWAPAEPGVKPELVCLVVTDDPSQGSHYGATCAGPPVRNLLQYGLENVLRLPKRLDLANTEDDEEEPAKATPRKPATKPTAKPGGRR